MREKERGDNAHGTQKESTILEHDSRIQCVRAELDARAAEHFTRAQIILSFARAGLYYAKERDKFNFISGSLKGTNHIPRTRAKCESTQAN